MTAWSGFDGHSCFHAVFVVCGQMTADDQLSRLVELVSGDGRCSCRNRHLARDRVVLLMDTSFMLALHQGVAKDELVIDGITVVNHEADFVPRLELERLRLEAGVIDVDN